MSNEETSTPSLSRFANYLLRAIMKNYYFGIIITSHTQGKIASDQLPFGVGKTTFMLQLSAKLNSPDYIKIFDRVEGYENWKPNEDDWTRVFENLVYNPCDLRDKLVTGQRRINFLGWDGVPYTAPRVKGVPKFLVRLKGELTEARPEVAVLGMTAPNRNDIASPLRSLPSFEVIIPRRGVFEVQRTLHFKKFYDPESDFGKLEYLEEGEFPQLPREVEDRYEKWRSDQKNYIKTREYQKRFKDLVREAEGFIGDEEEAKSRKPDVSSYSFSKLMRDQGVKAPKAVLFSVWQKLYKEKA